MKNKPKHSILKIVFLLIFTMLLANATLSSIEITQENKNEQSLY